MTRSLRGPHRVGPAKSARRRLPLAVRPLEDRVTPALDLQALAVQLDQSLAAAQAYGDQVLGTSVVALPIIGKPASDARAAFDGAIGDVRGALQQVINALSPESQVNAIKDALIAGLKVGGQSLLKDRNNNGQADRGDISITGYNVSAGNITIDLGLVYSRPITASLDFNLGLPGIPFRVTTRGNLQARAGIEYDHLQFGLKNNGFFFDASDPDELRVTLDAGVSPGASFQAVVGFFQVTAVPTPDFGLHAGFSVDIRNDNGLSFANPRLYGTANADLALTGSLADDGDLSWPNVTTDFKFRWAFGGGNADPTNPDAATYGGAASPVVRFDDVKVNAGNYINSVLRPYTLALQAYLTYYKPYLDLINFQIPGLTDVFDAARGIAPDFVPDKATILEIAKKLKNMGVFGTPPDPIVDALVTYSDLLSNLRATVGDLINPQTGGGADNLYLNLGSFDLSGNGGGNLRTLPPAGQAGPNFGTRAGGPRFDLTSLVPHALNKVTKSAADQFAATKDTYLKGVAAAMRRLKSQMSLTFPFSDTPVSGSFALLLGREADLVKFNIDLPGVFNVPFARLNALSMGVTTLTPAKLDVGGDLNVDLHLSGGYDTRGLRRLVSGETQDPLVLTDGFYLDSDQPLFFADGELTLSAGPKIGGTFEILGQKIVGAEIGIVGRGDFHFDKLSVQLDDPNADGDYKFRPFYSDGGRNLFAASGRLAGSVSIEAYAEGTLPILGTQHETLFELPLVDGEFFNFGTLDRRNPFARPGVAMNPAVDVPYDLATQSPLGHDGVPDVVYVLELNDKVRLMHGSPILGEGTLLTEIPYVLPNGSPVGKVLVRGSRDGTRFVLTPGPTSPIQIQVFGQADAPAVDVLEVPVPTFDPRYRNRLTVGELSPYGTNQVVYELVDQTTGQTTGRGALAYTRVQQVEVTQNPFSPTPTDVTVTGNVHMPVTLALGAGDDTVTLEVTDSAATASQTILVAGNGGADQLRLVRRSINERGEDRYTIDRDHLRAETRFRPADAFADAQTQLDVSFTGVETVAIDQDARRETEFQVRSLDAGQAVTLKGPRAVGVNPFPPAARYVLGEPDHSLERIRGTVVVDNSRGAVGTVVIDDTGNAGIGILRSSDQAEPLSTTTTWTVDNAGVGRRRETVYLTQSGAETDVADFRINLNYVNAVEVAAGSGDDTFNMYGFPTGTPAGTVLSGGAGNDTFTLGNNWGWRDLPANGATEQIRLVGGPGTDAFTLPGSGVTNQSGPGYAYNHDFTYELTGLGPAAARLFAVDHSYGFVYREFYTPYDRYYYADVSLDGFERATVDLTGTTVPVVATLDDLAAGVGRSIDVFPLISGGYMTGLAVGTLTFAGRVPDTTLLKLGAEDDTVAIRGRFPGLGLFAGIGGGTDTLSYWSYTNPVQVDLTEGIATDVAGGAGGFEAVVGGSGNDSLFGGNGGPFRLDGRGGDDLIRGGPLDDTLLGGEGADRIFGGDGNDTVYGGDLATWLRDWYGLRSNGNLRVNWGGRQEKWFTSRSGARFFITPDGSLWKWDRSPRTNLTGTLLARLDPMYYAHSYTLFDDAYGPSLPLTRPFAWSVAVGANEQYELRLDASYRANSRGRREKWLESNVGPVFMTPDGGLWKWDGKATGRANGERLTELDPLFWQTPELLLSAHLPQTARPVRPEGGSPDDNQIAGGNGDDLLMGGAGRDVIAGGAGRDTLLGGPEEDLLAGGLLVAPDPDQPDPDQAVVLGQVWETWTDRAVKRAVRVDALKTGIGSIGGVRVEATDDQAADLLTGGTGLDWVLKAPLDLFTDRVAGE